MQKTVETEIFKNLFISICEEMGIVLMKTAFSPNIKERRDYSTAIFDRDGEPIAQGDHMPVHLGAMPISVQKVLEKVPLTDGDTVILNNPFQGGTHLPDLTMVTPVFFDSKEPLFYVANRAHHADIGGMAAGSMPLATEIFQEGLIIPPIKIVAAHRFNDDLMNIILSNVRTPDERNGDIKAQIASNMIGKRAIIRLQGKYGLNKILFYSRELQEYTEKMMRSYINRIPDGRYQATDWMDDDGVGMEPVSIRVDITVTADSAVIDFSESDRQTNGNINANFAITFAATVFVFRCLIQEDVLYNSGIYKPLTVKTRRGTVVDATFPSAVAGGNVETSQRIVDVVLKALHPVLPETIPAASQGTMNNVSIGGIWEDHPFAYYETIGGGMGASESNDGLSGCHSHMTNSLNTPIEALENALPIRIIEYHLRKRSGGRGHRRGGDGVVRAYEMLADTQVSVLSERRRFSPYGLQEGEDGERGKNLVVKSGKTLQKQGKFYENLHQGDRLIIQTPGGGGYKREEDNPEN